jgi:transposase-like protein
MSRSTTSGVYRWVQRFTPLPADAARRARCSPGDRGCVAETHGKVTAGAARPPAIDQHGQASDVPVSRRRDADAAGRFLRRALATPTGTPGEVVAAAVAVHPRMPGEPVASAGHPVERHANPVETDHRRLQHRLRTMHGPRTDKAAQNVIAGHAFGQNLRRGHHELGFHARSMLRVAAAFTELTQAIRPLPQLGLNALVSAIAQRQRHRRRSSLGKHEPPQCAQDQFSGGCGRSVHAILAVMSTKIRRSAGSYTPLESWLDRAGIRRRDPARDVADFNNGQPFKVLCMTWTLGQTRTRRVGAAEMVVAKAGWLHIARGEEIVWRRQANGESVAIPAQTALEASHRQLYLRSQAAFKIMTPDGEHDIAIRRQDEDLVRLALVSSTAERP